MYNQNGEINGVKWSVKQLDERDFQLTVGDLVEVYTCQYPTIFGMDVYDLDMINRMMDEMQEKIELDKN